MIRKVFFISAIVVALAATKPSMAQSRFTAADRSDGNAESRSSKTGQLARVPIVQFVRSGPDGGPKFKTGGPILNFDRFEEELRNRLDGNCAGYSFAFNLNGNL